MKPPSDLPVFEASEASWTDSGALKFSGVAGGIGDEFYGLLGDAVIGTFRIVDNAGKREVHVVSPPWVSVRRELLAKRDGWLVGPPPRVVVAAFVDAAKQGGVKQSVLRLQREVDSAPAAGLVFNAALAGEPDPVGLGKALAALEAALKEATASTNAERPIVKRAVDTIDGLRKEEAVMRAVESISETSSAFGQKVRVVRITGPDPHAEAERRAAATEAAQSRAEMERLHAQARERLVELDSAATQAVDTANRAQGELAVAREQLEELHSEREAAKAERETARRNAKKAAGELKDVQDALTARQREASALAARVAALTKLVGPDRDAPSGDDALPVVELANEAGGWRPFVEELGQRGLSYQPAWAVRFLLATLAARRLGALVLLAGSTGTGKTQIVRTTADILVGAGAADIPVRPDWLNAADLLGYVDPIRGLFAPSDFVGAVRRARRARLQVPPTTDDPPPFLLLLDELNLARVENFGADLLSILERPVGATRAIRLYPEDQNRVWLAELERLQAEKNDPRRCDELQAFFDPRTTAEPESRYSHRLVLPDNLVVCGTLNTDRHTQELSPKVLDRSLVLQAPPLDVAEAFSPISAAVSPLRRVRVLPRPSVDTRATHPRVFEQFQEAVTMLRPCGMTPSRRMVRAAEAVVSEAARWWPDDPGPKKGSNELTAALLHMLLIPRIESSPADAHKPLDNLAKWLEARVPADHDVLAEVQELRDRAKASGKYGDLRGLR